MVLPLPGGPGFYKQRKPRDSRSGPMTESTGCSCRELRFKSQHPHGISQSPVTLVTGNLIPSSGLCGHQACTWCTDLYVDKTSTYMKFKLKKKIKSKLSKPWKQASKQCSSLLNVWSPLRFPTPRSCLKHVPWLPSVLNYKL